MGREARANKFSSVNAKPIAKPVRPNGTIEKRTKVLIPNSTLDLYDALFLGMVKGLRPMSDAERKEAEAQGLDLRAPDIIEREKELLKRFAPIQVEEKDVKIIITD